jgi:SAM-dependent methyltransferase
MIPAEGSVLDVGCVGYNQVRISRHIGLGKLKHYGVDWGEPEGAPEGFGFKRADLNKEGIPFPDDMFDFVVVSHIIEHLQNPLEFFADCLRVCKPGGIVYVESPSERALWIPGYPFPSKDRCYTISFFDDPTHVLRVWTPQAYYRLALCYSCEPIATGHLFSWIHRLLSPLTIPFCLLTKHHLLETCIWQTFGWACYVIVRKPASIRGRPPFHYYYPPRKFEIKVKSPVTQRVA